MKNNYLLSVIVPIYNGEKFIQQGVESLLRQTIGSKIEIILIDDGSSDGSSELLAKFDRKYKNITCIFQKNMGVSAARNAGLRIASGELIGFFDIDDYVEPNYFERLVKIQQKNNADIAISDFSMIFPDGSVRKHRNNVEKDWNNTEESIKDFFSGNLIGNNVVDKIFKRKILTNVLFPVNYKIGEDMYFVYLALNNADKVSINSRAAGYHYIIRKNSSMNSTFSEKYFDAVHLSEKMVDNCNPDVQKFAQAHLLHEECKLIENMYKNNGISLYKNEYFKYLKKIRNYKLLEVYPYLNKKQFSGYLLMRISPKLYMKVHDLMKIG